MITVNDLLEINRFVISNYGGMSSGVKDYNLLESCVVQINQEVFGEVLYQTVEDKIGWIVFSIFSNHIFLDGNKRTGVMTLEYLCLINKIVLDVSDDDLINLALGIATSKLKHEEVVDWIREHEIKDGLHSLNLFKNKP